MSGRERYSCGSPGLIQAELVIVIAIAGVGQSHRRCGGGAPIWCLKRDLIQFSFLLVRWASIGLGHPALPDNANHLLRADQASASPAKRDWRGGLAKFPLRFRNDLSEGETWTSFERDHIDPCAAKVDAAIERHNVPGDLNCQGWIFRASVLTGQQDGPQFARIVGGCQGQALYMP